MDITKILSSIRPDPASQAPLYLQIANTIDSLIREAALSSGDKLPPERELARLLGVSRTTAINAYSVLEERGLTTTRVGSGTYINDLSFVKHPVSVMPWEQIFTPQSKSPLSSLLRSLIAAPTAYNTISLAAGMPDPALYPRSVIEKLTADVPPLDMVDLGYIPAEGYLPLRRSLAAWQQKLGQPVSPDNLLVVSGSQQGLYLSIKVLVEPRDYVIVESPTYLGAIQILEAAGARILCLPDTPSLDFEVLEDYLVRYRPKLFYTIPTFQNPTGRVMPLKDRQELLRLAARHRLVIIEDDPYSHLYYDHQPPPPLKQLDPYGGVISLGTFSKILIPGLRIGWVSASPQVINRLAQEKQYVDLHSNNLSQRILQLCLEEDYLSQHLKQIRSEYKKRRDALAASLRRYCGNHMSFDMPAGGFYLWCLLKPAFSSTELLRRAAALGVSFVPGEAFYANKYNVNKIRLSFSTHDEEVLTQGGKLLGRVFAAAPEISPAAGEAAGRPLL